VGASAWYSARAVENNRGLWEKVDGDRRHLLVASAVCCRDTAGILASLWRLLAARREAMVVIVAVTADVTLYGYRTTRYSLQRGKKRERFQPMADDGKKMRCRAETSNWSEHLFHGAGQSGEETRLKCRHRSLIFRYGLGVTPP